MMHHKTGGPIELIGWTILGGFWGASFGILILTGLGLVFGPFNSVVAFLLGWLVPTQGAVIGIADRALATLPP